MGVGTCVTGFSDGRDEGKPEGMPVGTCVTGFNDGRDEGNPLGENDGDCEDGLNVGASVVGARVGCLIITKRIVRGETRRTRVIRWTMMKILLL